jgi:hypothetical protein
MQTTPTAQNLASLFCSGSSLALAQTRCQWIRVRLCAPKAWLHLHGLHRLQTIKCLSIQTILTLKQLRHVWTHRVLRKRSCSAPSRDFVCSQSHLHCHLNHFQTSSNIVIIIQRAQRHPKYLLHHSTTVHYSSLQFTTVHYSSLQHPLAKMSHNMSQVHHSSHPRHRLSIKKDGSSGRSRRTAVTRAWNARCVWIKKHVGIEGNQTASENIVGNMSKNVQDLLNVVICFD